MEESDADCYFQSEATLRELAEKRQRHSRLLAAGEGISMGGKILSFASVSNDFLLVGLANRVVSIISLSNWKCVKTAFSDVTLIGGPVSCVCYRKNEVLAGSWDGWIRRLHPVTLEPSGQAQRIHTDYVKCLISASDCCVISGCASGYAYRWKVDEQCLSLEWKKQIHKRAIERLAISNGRLITISSDQAICVSNLESGALVERYQNHCDSVTAMEINQHSDRLYTGDASGTIIAWVASAMQPVGKLSLGTSVKSLAACPEAVAVGTGNGDILIFSPDLSEKLKTIEAHSDQISILFCFKQHFLISGSIDGYLKRWSLSNSSLVTDEELQELLEC